MSTRKEGAAFPQLIDPIRREVQSVRKGFGPPFFLARVRYGPPLAYLKLSEQLTEGYKTLPFVTANLPLLMAAAIYNQKLAREYLGDLFSTLYDERGSPQSPAYLNRISSSATAQAYRRWNGLVTKTPLLPDEELIALFLGLKDPLKAEVDDNKLRNSIVSFLVPAMLGILAGVAAGHYTSEELSHLPPLVKALICGVIEGIDTFTILKKFSKTQPPTQGEFNERLANRVLFSGISGVGTIILLQTIFRRFLDPSFTGLIGANTGYLTFRRLLPFIDLFLSPTELDELKTYWVGGDDGENTEEGRFKQVGESIRHLFPHILGLRDAKWIQQGKGRQLFPGLKNFFDSEGNFFDSEGNKEGNKETDLLEIVLRADFTTDNPSNELLIRMLTTQGGVPIPLSAVLLRTAGCEWLRALLRSTNNEMLGHFLPDPKTLQNFIEERVKSRVEAMDILPKDSVLRLVFVMPTLFRILWPELATNDEKKLPAWWDAVRYGQQGENRGNTGILFPALREYWTKLLNTFGDMPFLQRIISALSREQENPNSLLRTFRNPFNEIIAQQLVPEAFTCGLLFALEGGSTIKEIFKLEGALMENIETNPENLMIAVTALSVLDFYRKILEIFKPIYVDNYEGDKNQIAALFDSAINNINRAQKEIIKALLHHFIINNPSSLITQQNEGNIRADAFTYLIQMLALENPDGLGYVKDEIEELLTASGEAGTGFPKSLTHLYAFYFIQKLTSPSKDQKGDYNQYGINTSKLSDFHTAVNTHLTELACDIITSHLGLGSATYPIEQINPDYLRQSSTAIQICAEAISMEGFLKLVQTCLSQLSIVETVVPTVVEDPEKIERIIQLLKVSSVLVARGQERFATEVSALNDTLNTLKEKIITISEAIRTAVNERSGAHKQLQVHFHSSGPSA